MALMKLVIFLLIYCSKTVYIIINGIPIVSTFIQIAERIFFFYLWSLLLACNVVRSVGNSCFAVTGWCVFLTFLPIYMQIWMTNRLFFPVTSKVLGHTSKGNESYGSAFSVLRLILHSLPVIGPMFASAVCRILFFLNIPKNTATALRYKVAAVKKEVNSMLDQVNQTSLAEIILRCLSTQRTPATYRIPTGREEKLADDVQILSVESTNANESSLLTLFQKILMVVPFGKDVVNFTTKVFALPSTCVTRCEDVVRSAVQTIETIHGFPQKVINSINDLEDRLAKVESANAKQACRFRQLTDDISSHCNKISQVQRDFASRLEKQGKDHQQSLEKLRMEYGELQMTTKNDMLKILCKFDEAIEKFEVVAKLQAVTEESSGATPSDASSTAEIPPLSKLQGNAAKRHQANSSFSFPGFAFAKRWIYRRGR